MLQIKVGIALSFVISLLFSNVPKPEGLVFPAFSNPSRSEGAWRTGAEEGRGEVFWWGLPSSGLGHGSGLWLGPVTCKLQQRDGDAQVGKLLWRQLSQKPLCCRFVGKQLGDGWAAGSDLDPHGLCFSNFPTRSSCQRRWDSDPSLQQPTPTVTLLWSFKFYF